MKSLIWLFLSPGLPSLKTTLVWCDTRNAWVLSEMSMIIEKCLTWLTAVVWGPGLQFLPTGKDCVVFACYAYRKWGLCEYIIVYTILGGSPVILWLSLGGKQKWPPLKVGYHDVMRTSPFKTPLMYDRYHPGPGSDLNTCTSGKWCRRILNQLKRFATLPHCLCKSGIILLLLFPAAILKAIAPQYIVNRIGSVAVRRGAKLKPCMSRVQFRL